MTSEFLCVRDETKASFDTILKSALKSKSEDPDDGEIAEKEDSSSNYILEKFLSDASRAKAPVPLPRSTRSSASSSISRSSRKKPEETVIEMTEIRKSSKKSDENSGSSRVSRVSKVSSGIPEDKVEEAEVVEEVQYDKNSELLGLHIYKTDYLTLNAMILHPIVKIHIVDGETGKYLKCMRNNQDKGYLQPKISKIYNMKQERSLQPIWNELIVFDEYFDYILKYDNIILFFEILDFLSFNEASLKYQNEGSNSGWYKIAWAFLKPHQHIEKYLRLQLYLPRKYNKMNELNSCVLYDWLTKKPLKKYCSTLYLTVKRVKPTENQDCEEQSTKLLKSPKSDITMKEISWSRSKMQVCRLPNRINLQVKIPGRGCLMTSFSNNGFYIASGVAQLNEHFIIVYEVSTGNEVIKFSGHQGLIYDIYWSKDDKYVITSSADHTACVWDFDKRNLYRIEVLPHPSYVYCARINIDTVVSGCYDKVIRIWKKSNFMELKQELEGHSGFITSICLADNIFYSSDNVGCIQECIFDEEKQEWNFTRCIKLYELRNITINKLLLFPSRTDKLVVFCRDNVHRLLDLKENCIVQWYRGSLNCRLQLYGSLSPCGSYVLAPSEDGLIYVWDVYTGAKIATYRPYKEGIVVHCIQYHPHDNIVAISSLNRVTPLLLCSYEYQCDEQGFITYMNVVKNNINQSENRKNNEETQQKRKKRDVTENINLENIIEKINSVIDMAKHSNE